MNNQDTEIRPTTPGQSVRAINWNWGEDKKPELYGPVGTYVGRNPDEECEQDQQGIFSFFGEEHVGDTINSFAVVEDEPHTIGSFLEALRYFPHQSAGCFNPQTFMDEHHGKNNWYIHKTSDHSFYYSIEDNDTIAVHLFTFYDDSQESMQLAMPDK